MRHKYLKPEIKLLHLRLNSFITASNGDNNNSQQKIDYGDGTDITIGEGGDNNDPNADPNQGSRWLKSSMWE